MEAEQVIIRTKKKNHIFPDKCKSQIKHRYATRKHTSYQPYLHLVLEREAQHPSLVYEVYHH